MGGTTPLDRKGNSIKSLPSLVSLFSLRKSLPSDSFSLTSFSFSLVSLPSLDSFAFGGGVPAGSVMKSVPLVTVVPAKAGKTR
jgi:hypothetical protein